MSLIKIWKEKGNILEGIKNRIFKQEHIEEIYEERMVICKACPHIDTNGSECYVPGTQPCCSKCGCSLALKLRSLSSGCGDEENPRWNAILTEEEEDELNNQ
jgi:hypothetical protein